MKQGDEAAHLEHVLEEFVLHNGYHFGPMEGCLLAEEVIRLRAEVASLRKSKKAAKEEPRKKG